MGNETHKLQPDPPEGSRPTVERELERQQNHRENGPRKFKESRPEGNKEEGAGAPQPNRKA